MVRLTVQTHNVLVVFTVQREVMGGLSITLAPVPTGCLQKHLEGGVLVDSKYLILFRPLLHLLVSRWQVDDFNFVTEDPVVYLIIAEDLA